MSLGLQVQPTCQGVAGFAGSTIVQDNCLILHDLENAHDRERS
jgi:hypothetical protein